MILSLRPCLRIAGTDLPKRCRSRVTSSHTWIPTVLVGIRWVHPMRCRRVGKFEGDASLTTFREIVVAEAEDADAGLRVVSERESLLVPMELAIRIHGVVGFGNDQPFLIRSIGNGCCQSLQLVPRVVIQRSFHTDTVHERITRNAVIDRCVDPIVTHGDGVAWLLP